MAKLIQKKVKEIKYSREKKAVTIIYSDGSMKGWNGDIAIEMANKLKLEEEIENETNYNVVRESSDINS